MANPNTNNQNSQEILGFAQFMAKNGQNFSNQQIDQTNKILADMVNNSNAAEQAMQNFRDTLDTMGVSLGNILKGGNKITPFMDDFGAINATELSEELRSMSDKDLTKALTDFQSKMNNSQNSIKEFSNNLMIFQNKINQTDFLKNIKSGEIDLKNETQDLIRSFNDLKDVLSPDTYNRYKEILDKITNSTNNTDEMTDELVGDVTRLIEKLKNANINNIQEIKNFEEKAGKELTTAYNAQNAADDTTKIGQKYKEGYADQKNIQNILDTVNAVQQLTFAWQSFQNLGSLWANEDLSTGEKILQTIMNITMAMSQLLPALDSLKSSSILNNINDSLSNLSLTWDTNKLNSAVEGDSRMIAVQKEINNLMLERQTIAGHISKLNQQHLLDKKQLRIIEKHLVDFEGTKKERGREISRLRKSIAAEEQKITQYLESQGVVVDSLKMKEISREALHKVITAELIKQVALQAALSFGLPLLLAGLAAAVGYFQQQREEAEKLRQEQLEASNERTAQTKESLKNIHELYQKYKETGEGADELKQALEEEAEALGVVVTAADNYETLKEKIDKATASQLAYNAALRGEDTSTTKTTATEAGLTFEDKKALGIDTTAATYVNTANGQMQYQADGSASADIAETVEKSKELINLEQQSITNRNAEIAILDRANKEENDRYILLQQQNRESQDRINRLTNYVESNKDYLNNEYEQAENIVLSTALNSDTTQNILGKSADFSSASYGEALKYVQNLTSYLKITEEQQQQLTADALEYAGNLESAAEAQLAIIENQIQDNPMHYSREGDYRNGEQAFNNLKDFGQLNNLSNQELIKLSELVDWTDPDVDTKFAQKLNQLQEQLNKGLSLDEALKIQRPEDIKTAIAEMEPRDSDLDTGVYQEMAKYLAEVAGEMEGIPEQVGQSAEMLQNFTEAILRYDDALQDADEHLSDWRDLLLNTGEASEDDAVYLEDLMEAFEGMRDMIGDLLDMDVSDLSHEFMQNADVLNLLDEAIYGVGEEADAAYDKLHYLAQLDMLGLIDWTDGIEDELAAYEADLISLGDNIDLLSLKANDLGANASYAMGIVRDVLGGEIPGPDLDLTAFTAGLADMVNNGEMSIEAALAAMDQAGVSADVTQEVEEGEEVEGHIDATPKQTDGIQVNDTITGTATGGGGPSGILSSLASSSASASVNWSGHVHGVGWTMQDATETAPTQHTTTAVKYNAERGAGAGKINFTNAHRTPSGSTKRNASGGNHSSPSSGGGGGGKSCFVAGTLVSTIDNFKNIEDIKVGDIVLSYNEQTQQNEYSQVLQTMIHATIEPIYTLYIRNEQLRVTGIHKFLIKRNDIIDWIKAEDLKLGDWVLFADGTWHLILDIDVNVEAQIVYNFEVSHNHNYYVGEYQILAHNKGGGGGGSGSGSKGKTVEAKEHEKHQKKYYEEVEHQLDKTGKILDNVEKTTDKMIGTKARAKQNEQIKLLQKEIQLQEKKLKILQEQEKVDVEKAIKKADSELEKLLSQEGIIWKIPNIEFDEDGIIKNTDEINKAIIDGQNKLIDKRNAIANRGEISESEQEEIKRIDKIIDKYKKLGDELGKNNDRYNDIIVEIEDLNNTVDELQDKIQDISIDMYKASQEAIDNLKELREEWAKFSAEFFYDKSKGEQMLSLDDPLTKAKELNNIMSSIYDISGSDARKFYQDIIEEQERLLKTATTDQEKKTYQNVIDYYKELQKGIDDNISINNGLLQIAVDDLRELQNIWDNWEENSRDNPIFGDNKAALKERLEDAQKRVQELALEYKKNIEELMDNAVDIAERISDMWDQQLDRFDRVNDQLERYIDSYTLIFGDESYDAQAAIYEQQAKNLEQKLNTAEIAYEQARQRYLEAKEKFTDPETGLVDRIFEEQVRALEEAMNDAEDAYRDTAEEAAKLWVEAFEASVNAANKKALQTVFGSAGMDYVERNWEWEKEYNDKYRDDVEKAYELDKLRSKYINLLNDAQGTSLQTQNKIRAQMQEQLDLLENQATVSEYDVKLANAKLEILQKQIALEDAQRNKNKMQLRRDTQGNYRYVYSANQNDVDQARQDLLDTEYDAYELSKNQQIANYDDLLNAFKRYQSQVLEISTNMNLSAEERERQLKELRDKYLEYLELSQEDFEDSTAGTLDILRYLVENGTDYTATSAKNMLEQILDEEGNLIEQSGIFWMDHAVQARDEIIPTIQDAVIEASDTIIDKMYNVRDTLIGTDGTGGIFPEITGWTAEYGDAVNEAANQTEILVTATNHLQDALMADNIAFEEQLTYIQSLTDELGILSDQASATAAQLRSTQEARERAEAEKVAKQSQIDRLLSGEDIIEDHRIVSAAELAERKRQAEAAAAASAGGGGLSRNRVEEVYDLINSGAVGNAPARWGNLASRGYSQREINAGQELINRSYATWDNGWGWDYGDALNWVMANYDTGGYTGIWNQGIGPKNGRVAVLHQKELVLNADDTKNILTAVDMMRNIINSNQGIFNGLVKQASANNISSAYSSTTEQRVEIQATFPNATDANDIREALLGLSDKAYQYAHRRI